MDGCPGYPVGGPGYAFVLADNTTMPKRLVLEVRDANNSIRVNSANGVMLQLVLNMQ